MMKTQLNPNAVGLCSVPWRCEWVPKDAQLYAIAVGAGAGNPLGPELKFTTENTHDLVHVALPTFATVAAVPSFRQIPNLGQVDLRSVLHGQQRVTLSRPIPLTGVGRGITRVTKVLDKGRDAVVELEAEVCDADSGEQLFTVASQTFIRGGGGWGGDRSDPSPQPDIPDRAPDCQVQYATSPNQALLYRLCGDRNPLHSDPWFALQAGYERPILHGLCTFGFTGRAVLEAACDWDPARLSELSARFVRPLFPGEPLTIQVWLHDEGAYVRALDSQGRTVLDRGAAKIAAPICADRDASN